MPMSSSPYLVTEETLVSENCTSLRPTETNLRGLRYDIQQWKFGSWTNVSVYCVVFVSCLQQFLHFPTTDGQVCHGSR